MIRDSSGFVRCSNMFEGNVAESSTLEEMLKEMNALQRRSGHYKQGYCNTEEHCLDDENDYHIAKDYEIELAKDENW